MCGPVVVQYTIYVHMQKLQLLAHLTRRLIITYDALFIRKHIALQ